MKSFGEEKNEFCDRVRKELIKKGMIPDSPELFFAVENAYTDSLKGRPSFAETSKLLNEKWEQQAYKKWEESGKSRTILFTGAELEYIIEKLFGSNDPIGRDILEKIQFERNLK